MKTLDFDINIYLTVGINYTCWGKEDNKENDYRVCVSALAKTKNAAKEAIEKDLGKIKTPNKLVNGLIAGTALALVGLGIGSSMKKDQA